jgi:uncharacterized protein Yka (UPF0111/DUF47 family)
MNLLGRVLPNDCCKTFLFFKDLRGVISSLEAFASQFTSLEADKVQLQEEAKSTSSKLDDAIKKAAIARQEVDSLKEELNKLKEKLKEEEARSAEKDDLLRQSALTLLGKLFHTSLVIIIMNPSMIFSNSLYCRGRQHPCHCLGQRSK